MLTNNLQKLGFSENEARVYLALLEEGFGTTGPLIKKTGLHRNIVYETLDKLVKCGLSSVSMQKGKKHFRALSPVKILQREKTQFEMAQKLVPFLIKMQKQEKQEVIIYEGNEGFQNAHLDAIEQMKSRGCVYVMMAGGKRWYDNMENGLKKFDKIRLNKNIKEKIIALESQQKDLANYPKRPLWEVRFLPETFNNPSGISVYDNVTLILVYGSPVLAMIIKNPAVALGFKQQFDILWKIAKK
ncbi:MAG: helix-turn-helix domain-containing protein [bacterium]|nr:helix-turn-helix domain-containing protein [bacterium]